MFQNKYFNQNFVFFAAGVSRGISTAYNGWIIRGYHTGGGVQTSLIVSNTTEESSITVILSNSVWESRNTAQGKVPPFTVHHTDEYFHHVKGWVTPQ